MPSKDPTAIRRQSIQFLHDVSKILRDLADEIETAVVNEECVDTQSIENIARELQVNHETLLLLSNVNSKLGQIKPRLN